MTEIEDRESRMEDCAIFNPLYSSDKEGESIG